MGKRVSFATMKNSVYLVIVGLVLSSILGACATDMQRGSEAGQVESSENHGVQTGVPVDRIDAKPTDEDVMYRVFAAEYLGSEGDLDAAVEEYLAAALKSDDVEIARRATQVAFAAEAWQQGAMAADRWTVLDPTNVAAHEAATAAMLLVGDYMGAEYQIMSILDLMGDTTDAWMLVSGLLSQAGSPEHASEILDEVLSARGETQNANAMFARSQLAVRSQDLEKAFELARQAVEMEPEQVEFLTWAVRLALKLKLT